MHELRDGSDKHELRDGRDAQADLACVASGDWDLLFRAVQQRLWQALVSVAPTAPASLRAAEQMLALECVDIIEKLYRMLVDTRRRGGPVAVGSRADDGRRRGETLQRL